jgi:hypothetical protein
MITLNNQPSQRHLSGELARYKFTLADSSGDPYRSYGATARLLATGAIVLADGDDFDIEWTEPNGASYDITITAVLSPSSDTEIQAGGTGNLAYYEAIAEKLDQHPIIGSLFNISAIQDGSDFEVIFEAIDRDSDFTVDLNITNIVTGGFSKSNTAPVADNTPDGYALLIDVFFEDLYDSAKYARIATLRTAPNEAGVVDFDIQTIISKKVEESISDSLLPSLPVTAAYAADRNRNYFIRYKESFDGDTNAFTSSSTREAVAGRLDKFVQYQDYLSNITSGNPEDSFFSYQVYPKVIGASQVDFLHWYNYSASSKRVKLKIESWSDAGAAVVAYAYDITVPSDGVASFPVTPSALGLASTIKRYRVTVVDYTTNSSYSGTAADQPVFLIDRRYRNQEYYFVGLNSFYLPEGFRCYAEADISEQIDRELATNPIFEGFSIEDREQFQANYSNQVTYTFRTGYLQKDQLEGLRDLMLYNQIWMISGTDYIRMLINTDTIQIKQNEQYLYSLTFAAVRSIRSRAHAKLLI